MKNHYLELLNDKLSPWNAKKKFGLVIEIIKGNLEINEITKRYGINEKDSNIWIDKGLDALETALRVLPPREHVNIDLVLDIGANVGQYAKKIREEGYKGRIVSFEPLVVAHAELCGNSAGDRGWVVHDRCAVGAQNSKESVINVSGNSFSSSLLNILDSHKKVAPDSAYVTTETVKIITIDSIFKHYVGPEDRVMLKIDTQGYEDEVLKGCVKSLEKVSCIRLELSIIPLYANQKLYDYFFGYFTELGFLLWDIQPGFRNTRTGQLLQFDAVFLRATQ